MTNALVQDFEQCVIEVVTQQALPLLQKNYRNLWADARAKGDAFFKDNDSVASWKKDGKGLVTQGELEVERAVRVAIHDRFPSMSVIGEELDDRMTDSQYVAVIDPVDGTSAMVRSVIEPDMQATLGFGISIGLLENDQAVAGIIIELEGNGDELTIGKLWSSNDSARDASAPVQGQDITLISTAPEVMFTTQQQRAGFTALETMASNIVCDRNCIGFMDLLSNPDAVVIEADLSVHDAAAIVPILAKQGITVTDHDGHAVTFGNLDAEYKLLAATPELHGRALRTYQEGQSADVETFSSRLNRASLNQQKFRA